MDEQKKYREMSFNRILNLESHLAEELSYVTGELHKLETNHTYELATCLPANRENVDIEWHRKYEARQKDLLNQRCMLKKELENTMEWDRHNAVLLKSSTYRDTAKKN